MNNDDERDYEEEAENHRLMEEEDEFPITNEVVAAMNAQERC